MTCFLTLVCTYACISFRYDFDFLNCTNHSCGESVVIEIERKSLLNTPPSWDAVPFCVKLFKVSIRKKKRESIYYFYLKKRTITNVMLILFFSFCAQIVPDSSVRLCPDNSCYRPPKAITTFTTKAITTFTTFNSTFTLPSATPTIVVSYIICFIYTGYYLITC